MSNLVKNYQKPFLRWAGGKSWLVKHLDSILLNTTFNNYHEPFIGGGAIFFALSIPQKSFLSDTNEELINTYLAIKNSPEQVINILKEYENNQNFYYRLRDSVFCDEFQRAARFIYLNQTSYNGLYRVNQKGKYNVPYGYRKKNFLDEQTLLEASKKLQFSSIISCDFMSTLTNIEKGDLVFLDPPYTVSHNNNGFIKYNQKLFSLDDQIRLSEFINKIKSIGAYYILTNAAHDTIFEIFNKGDRLFKIDRANLIGGENAKRGHTTEYIFSNI